MSNNTCDMCKFAHKLSADATFCRRFPPTLMSVPRGVQAIAGGDMSIDWTQQASAFPLVRPNFWCGEHQLIEHSAILKS